MPDILSHRAKQESEHERQYQHERAPIPITSRRQRRVIGERLKLHDGGGPHDFGAALAVHWLNRHFLFLISLEIVPGVYHLLPTES